MLIHKSLSFTLMDLHLDPGGRFVIMHMVVAKVPMAVVGLYIPPPASLTILNKITQYLANLSVENIVLAGDFSMPPCPALDRLTPGGAWTPHSLAGFPLLASLMSGVGRIPSREYTCQSAT